MENPKNQNANRDIFNIRNVEGDFIVINQDNISQGAEVANRLDNSFKVDYIKLQKKSLQVMKQVLNRIGGQVHLPRTNQLEQLETYTVDNTITIIVGASGVGKSSLVRDYAETQIQKDETVLWFDSRSFEKIDFAAFESDLQLANSLDEVVQSLSTKKGLLVLDGLDRLYNSDSFKLLSTFLRLFDFHQEQPQWRLLITCQNQDLSRLSAKLIHTLPGISFNEFICKPLLIEDLEPLWSSFPKASRLKYQTQLRDILGNLKILDLVATRLNLDDDIEVDRWVGESSVIEWFWNSYIKNTEQGISKSCLVQKIAEYQADNLKQRFPLSQTEQSQLTIIESLIKDKIFNQTQDNSIVFQHDLYGDWFRLQLLISHSDNLASYLKDRLVSPMWHRAVRLYGQYLLENCRDVEKWTNTLDNLKNNDILLAQNLLLASPIFAADPFPLLVLIYQSLIANEGQLLKRLLAQFLISATRPDQQMLEISRSLGHNETEASANFRIPYCPFWLPILRFIHDYREEFINIAPIEICQVVHLWLEHIPQNSIFRSEVAEIGLMLGEKALLAKDNYKSVFHKNRKDFYRVALMGAREFPEQISDFALRASERIARANTPEEDEELKYIPDKRFFPLSFDPTEPLPEPWPDGPKRRVDDDFRHVVFELQTILPLIQVNPSVAREVILAVLISVRRRFKKYLIRTYKRQFDIEEIYDWQTLRYGNEPFLRFLQLNFKEGLELIARLVNFATDRWLFSVILDANEYALQSQSQRESDNAISHVIKKDCCYPQPLSIVVNQCKYEFIGDSRVYGWSSGLGTIPPDEIVVALMALEQYFYLRIEREENIDEEITLVLKKVKSTAILGLLCNVGKRLPMLFEGPLKPLLGIPELYFWDIKVIVELAHKFNQLEHRKKDLRHLACELLLTSSDIRDFFEDIRSQWEKRLSMNVESELRDFLKQLIITFDINNFEIQQHSKFGQVVVNVAAQKLVEEKVEEIQAAEMKMLISVFPYRCREILEKDKCLEKDELELLWQELQQIEFIYIHKDKYLQYSMNQLAACILGGISVFIKFHQSWLDTYSERKQWCLNYIKNFIFEPPPLEQFDVPESIGDTHWDCFLAETLPLIWRENIDDKNIRELIARMVFTYHYNAVNIFFCRCSEFRVLVGEDFTRLRRFLFEWAFVKNRIISVEQIQDLTDQKVIDKFFEDLNKWREKRIKAFVDKKIEPIIKSWTLMDQPQSFRAIDKVLPQWRQQYFLDFSLIEAGHSWFPNLDKTVNEKERCEIIFFWQEALSYIIKPISEPRKKNQLYRDSFLPRGYETWVLENIAKIIQYMDLSECPQKLWQPILNLPKKAHYWPEYFLRGFHRYGLQQNPIPPSYIRVLRSIIDYSLPSNHKNPPKWSYHDDVWSGLIGLDQVSINYWEEHNTYLVQEIQDLIEYWFKNVPVYSQQVARFARWLKIDAAESIRLQGIVWIEQVINQQNNNHLLKEESVMDSIASLLNVAWNNDQKQLRQKDLFFGAFKSLLYLLSERQNRVAIELSKLLTS